MPNKRNHWITPQDKGWGDLREGNQRPSRVYSTQKEAFEAAREIAKKEGGEVFIQNRGGKIRERNTYGKADPYPPKG
jgi:hypothetical protein